MNSQELAKRLKKEFLRSPKKTAALVLCTLVAGWFWAPLVAAWLKAPSEDAHPSLAASVSGAVEAIQAPAVRRTAPTNWRALLEARRRDSRTEPAPFPPGAVNPFARRKAMAGELAHESPATAPASPHHTPAELGLELTGAVVGPAVKLAIINGRKFREQETVMVGAGGQWLDASLGESDVNRRDGPPPSSAPRWEFQVVHVASDHVVLQGAGGEHRLTMRRAPALAAGKLQMRPRREPIDSETTAPR